jgi:hypothetical protein
MSTTYISGPYLRQYPTILNELKRLHIVSDVRYVELTTKTASEMGYTSQVDEQVIDTTSPDFVKNFKGIHYVNPQQAAAILHTGERVPLAINEYIHYYSEPISETELSREETEEIDAKVGRIHSQFTAIENEMTELLERVKELEHQVEPQMDERLLAIVKAVALDTGLYCDDRWDVNCAFCGVSDEAKYIAPGLPEIKHSDDCKVTFARAILKELGIPVCIYKMEFDISEKHIERYVLATNEAEAMHEYKDYKLQRNIQATLVREL